MYKGGNLKSHNRETGWLWLAGTYYLKMLDKDSNSEDGDIEFSYQGLRYPAGDSL